VVSFPSVVKGLGGTIDGGGSSANGGGGGSSSSEFSVQELRDLFAFHEGTKCQTLELLQRHEKQAVTAAAAAGRGANNAASGAAQALKGWGHHEPPLGPLPDEALTRAQHVTASPITFVFYREGNAAVPALVEEVGEDASDVDDVDDDEIEDDGEEEDDDIGAVADSHRPRQRRRISSSDDDVDDDDDDVMDRDLAEDEDRGHVDNDDDDAMEEPDFDLGDDSD
jgi:hypothetical protein